MNATQLPITNLDFIVEPAELGLQARGKLTHVESWMG